MDDIAVGRLIMLARQRKQWRQVDLAMAAGVSQSMVALAEAGAIERLTVRSLRRIGAPLEIRLPLAPLWNGGEADRLRDRDHASIVDAVSAILREYGWEIIVEYTFSHYGERGSIDIVAWHAPSSTLLVIEVKTRIYDVQALVAGVDRKARLAGQLLRADRGWTPAAVARLVVVPELGANRSLVARHRSLFDAALPARSREIRTWLRLPSGAISGVWFLSITSRIGGIQVGVGRQRVRVPRKPRMGVGDSPTTDVDGG
ncbi:MAG: helix-turn-helix domain-containing protein [Candidatus Limnocylindria bacterium]